MFVVRMVGITLGSTLLALGGVGAAHATSPPGTGQPSQTCGSDTAMQTPGNASSASGSAFNPNGMAGSRYAGTQPQNSGNPTSVSQYDVACFQVSSR